MPSSPQRATILRRSTSSNERPSWTTSTGTLRVAALDVCELVVREADGAHEALVGEFCHRSPGLFERDSLLVREVEEVDVDVVASEPLEAAAAGGVDLVPPEAAIRRP